LLAAVNRHPCGFDVARAIEVVVEETVPELRGRLGSRAAVQVGS
jgi:hypothetical protein